MKDFIRAYTNLSAEMRMGIIALVCLVLVGIGVRMTMQYWVKPDIDVEKQSALIASWEQSHPPAADSLQTNITTEKGEKTVSELFLFDPNTLDSAGFRKLGLKEKTTHYLLNWRRKGKKFYKKEDLKPLYTLSQKEYKRLEPYISIADN